MGKFTQIPQDTFNSLQLDAGVLLKSFNPDEPVLENENIICATTGGITASCVPTYSDMGEDVDNAPNGMKELMKLEGWETSLSFTALTVSEETVKLALGAYTQSGNEIVPTRDIDGSFFSDIWWVGDLSDGGCVAIKLENALSTGGLTLTTAKNGKGTMDITLTGHFSIDAQDKVPMEFYVISAA